MKYLLILPFIVLSLSTTAQNCLTRDSIFQNFDEKLIHSEVVLIDSVSQAELIRRAKNWGGTAFVNLKEVLVAETDNQLVFNYISSNAGGMIASKEYIRLVVQFKDGRIKASFYDDGNVYTPSTQYSSAVAARTYYYTNTYKEPETILCEKGLSKAAYQIHKSFKKGTLSTMSELKTALQKSADVVNDDF
jgi:hypothetical protein